MSIYDDIKREKLEHLLEWLQEQEPTEELIKLMARLEQQITFLKLPPEEGEKYFKSIDTR
jgi:hypothetical protein